MVLIGSQNQAPRKNEGVPESANGKKGKYEKTQSLALLLSCARSVAVASPVLRLLELRALYALLSQHWPTGE